ncbi:MAG: hypothetical protein ACI4R9_06495 [Kiritimatiellia bacterium]
MKRIRHAAHACLLFALTGCATAKISDVGGHTIADVANTGWYLFNLIPIASGNPERPNAADCRIFSRTVTIENNLRMLDYAMRTYLDDPALLARVRYGEVVSYTTDESVLFFLLKRHTCHTSAELVLTPEPTSTIPEPKCESQNP